MKWESLLHELFEGLIKINTTNPKGNEKAAALYLKNVFDQYGIPCRVQEISEDRANFLAEFDTGKPGKTLMFNGHLDVVPAVGEWSVSPFSVTEKDGRLYGRGSCDMKGAIAAFCTAVISLIEEGKLTRGKVQILCVADEECDNLGTRYYFEQVSAEQKPDYAIIGEPTELLLAVAHRGVSRDYIRIRGNAGHAAIRPTERTAIELAAEAIRGLTHLNSEMLNREHEILPPPSIAITRLSAYEKDNVIPGEVEILTDFRILPDMEHEHVVDLLTEVMRRENISNYELKKHFYLPGGQLDPRDELAELMLPIIAEVTGKADGPQAFGAFCEQCFFLNHGIRAVICGPGSLKEAHTVDEFVEKDQLFKAVEIYRKVSETICGEQEGKDE
ncbi:MAG: M20 family metallopeptidase [Lachnospiraceae bacterium]|nr:M20 family metallopeptidase [Lachnospiraceae bacterium]